MLLYTDFDDLPRSDYAAAAYILTDCCKKLPNYAAMSRYLTNLYNATLTSGTSIAWCNKRLTSLRATVIDNRCALEGEDLEAEVCDLISECLLRPKAENGAFDENVTALMRAELIDAIDSAINDKSAYARQNANKHVFEGEPMALSPNGTHEQAERVTPRSAYNAYRKILKTAHVEILAFGSSDFSGAERVFTETFSKIDRRDICVIAPTPSRLKEKPLYAADKLEMQQAILRMYFKAPEMDDIFANAVFTVILGGMPTSRFFMNIREKQSLCYYCGCSSDRNMRTLSVFSGVEPKNIKRTQEAVIAEIKDICENGVSEDEMRAAKLEISNNLASLYDSPALIGWYLDQTVEPKELSPEEYRGEIEKVTSERIREAARKYTLDTVYTLSQEGEV